MQFPFEIGCNYSRRLDVHERFGGSRQSGMSPSAKFPVIFLFTGPTGEQHGYVDGFTNSGEFYYTGEGQVGDMVFTKGNKALRDHVQDGKHVLLFEQYSKGIYTYRGEFSYIGHHIEIRHDKRGDNRKVIVFELAFEPLDIIQKTVNSKISKLPNKIPKSISIEELRSLAVSGSSKKVISKDIQSRLYYRSEAVKLYALARAQGICECCGSPAPFINKKKRPYLEVHHINRVADGGPDSPESVASICPTCHKQIHHGLNGQQINDELREKVLALEDAV